jgi:hypothetical protein
MHAERRPEPTDVQLQAALERLHAAAPRIWPRDMAQLGDNAKKLVRARALQAMGETDLRSREQVPLVCSRADGQLRTRWVFGAPSNQLSLDEDLK